MLDSSSHTFLTTGLVTATVKIFDNGTLAATTTDTITVTPAAVTLSNVQLSSVIESNTASILATTSLATFTDGETTGSLLNDYTASINWGNGTTAGIITFSNGAYAITGGNHGYNTAGNESITVTLSARGGETITPAFFTDTVAVNPSITLTANPLSIPQGSMITSLELATFTNADANSLDTYTAQVAWSDSNNPNISLSGSEVFDNSSHTFLTTGPVTATVKIFDNGTLAATTTDTITVTSAAVALSNAQLSAVTESNSASILATTTLATFTDGETTGSLLNDYSASINWGNGITTGVITFSNGAYTITGGNHGYNTAGSESITITLTASGNETITPAFVTDSVTVNPSITLNANPLHIAQGSTTNSLELATFSNADGSSLDTYTAQVTWSDTNTPNISLSGSEVLDSSSHAFLTTGLVTATVKIFDNGTLTATTTDTITVTAATVALTGTQLQPVIESNTASIVATTPLATFTDGTTTGSLLNDYTASINWGNGITAGIITFSNGEYIITGNHHGYNSAGNESITITLSASGGEIMRPSFVTDAVTVNPSITLSANPVSVAQGTTITSLELATFSNSDANSLDTYTAQVSWSDNNLSNISFSGPEILDSSIHSFLATGHVIASVKIFDNGTLAATTTDTITVNAASVALTGAQLQPVTESNTSIVATTPLATFTDGTTTGSLLNDYTASINWGNGITAGIVTFSNGVYTITGGNHGYHATGTESITVALTATGGEIITPSRVTDIATISAQAPDVLAQILNFVKSNTATNILVGTFTNPDPNSTDPLTAYSATVHWSDNGANDSTAAASVTIRDSGTQLNGSEVYDVFDNSHTFLTLENQTATPTLTVSDSGVSAASINDTLTVSPVNITNLTGRPFSAIEGNINSEVLATFTDGRGNTLMSDYSASINWGDGMTSSGIIAFNGAEYTITGSHVYHAAGTDNFTVTLSATGGEVITPSMVSDTAIISAQAPVVNDILTVTTTNTNQNIIFSDVNMNSGGIVATDANSIGTPGEFLANINWSDGKNSIGTVIVNPREVFYVNSSHPHASANDFIIKFNAAENGGNAANIITRGTQGIVHPASPYYNGTSEPVGSINSILELAKLSVPQIDLLHEIILTNFQGITDLSGFHINNVASGSYKVSIHVDQGLLNFSSLAGLQLIFSQHPGIQGLGNLTFTGSLEDINTALSRLTYQSQQSFAQSYNLLNTNHLQITIGNEQAIYDNETVDLWVV